MVHHATCSKAAQDAESHPLFSYSKRLGCSNLGPTIAGRANGQRNELFYSSGIAAICKILSNSQFRTRHDSVSRYQKLASRVRGALVRTWKITFEQPITETRIDGIKGKPLLFSRYAVSY